MKRTIKTTSLYIGILAMAFTASNAYSKECGSLIISGGDTCSSLSVKFNLSECGESSSPKTAKITCKNDNLAIAKYSSNSHSYESRIENDGGLWGGGSFITQTRNGKRSSNPKKASVKKPSPKKSSAKKSSSKSSSRSSSSASIANSKFSLSGQGRVRTEIKNNTDFDSVAADSRNFIASRFRLNFGFNPINEVQVFFQPQFVKTWGANEIVSSGVSSGNVTGSSSGTSGALNDTGLDVHQAYIEYKPSDAWKFKIGRQEVIYGDHLLVGSVGWSNVARSFDAIKTTWSHGAGSTELLYSKITETNASSASFGDKDFWGLYNSFEVGSALKNLDLYGFYLADQTSTPSSNVIVGGARAKSKLGVLDYRAEVTVESVSSSLEHQQDLEIGFTVNEAKKSRIAVEVFRASEAFNQLFPTAHKWLGFADILKRQNVMGFRVGLSGKFVGKMFLKFDFHSFYRASTSVGAFGFSGSSLGTTGTSKVIGNEFDVLIKYPINSNLKLLAGTSIVLPGRYLKDNKGSSMAVFNYLQLAANF